MPRLSKKINAEFRKKERKTNKAAPANLEIIFKF